MYSFKEYIAEPIEESSPNVMGDIKSAYDKAISGNKDSDLIHKMKVLHGVVKDVSKKHNIYHGDILKSVDVDQFFRGE